MRIVDTKYVSADRWRILMYDPRKLGSIEKIDAGGYPCLIRGQRSVQTGREQTAVSLSCLIACAASLWLFAGAPAFGQAANATVTGTVLDSSGAAAAWSRCDGNKHIRRAKAICDNG
jgi:hypothetical protein